MAKCRQDIWQVLPSHNIIFAAGWLFADFAIAVIFYPVITTSWTFFCWLFAWSHILILRAKINLAKMLKIFQKSGETLNLLDFRRIKNIFAKSIFALKLSFWVCDHANNQQKKNSLRFLTAIAKSAKWHPAAKKCCGWEEPAICCLNECQHDSWNLI